MSMSDVAYHRHLDRCQCPPMELTQRGQCHHGAMNLESIRRCEMANISLILPLFTEIFLGVEHGVFLVWITAQGWFDEKKSGSKSHASVPVRDPG
jgi:hypothetical protein